MREVIRQGFRRRESIGGLSEHRSTPTSSALVEQE
jgi:hypothetical protein